VRDEFGFNGPKIIVTQAQAALSIGQSGGEKLVVNSDGGEAFFLTQHIQNLTVQNQIGETLVIRDEAGPTLQITETVGEGKINPYGQPYYQAEDAQYYYFSWQHTDATRWEAQRFDNASFEILTRDGLNPQPESVADFQGLSW